MIERFANKNLKRLFLKDDARGLPPQFATKIKMVLDALHAAERVEDLDVPGFGLHALSGDRAGTWRLSSPITGALRLLLKEATHLMSITKTTTENRSVGEVRPTHPGALLREIVVPASGLTQTELAQRLGISRRSVNMILNEQRPVTVDVAHRLGRLFGNGPTLWLNMQRALDVFDSWQRGSSEYSRIEPLPSQCAV